MRRVKVAAAALNQTPLDWDHNAANIRRAIDAARHDGVDVLCLPELCITGYGCEDAFHSPGVSRMARQVLAELLPNTFDIVVSLGLPISYRGGLFNCAALVVDTQIAGFVGKQNLAGEGLHYEPRWFKPWPNDALGELDIGDRAYPLGDLVFDCGGVRIGFEICEDAWVLDRPGGELAQQGVDILLNPSASHFAFGKHQVRRRLVLDGSRAFFTAYVYANLLGNEAGRAIYDGDAMIAEGGVMLARGKRFSFHDFELTSAVIDIDATRMTRRRSSSFPVQVEKDASNVVEVTFSFRDDVHETPATPIPAWENSERLKEEEFTRAIVLGMFDYLRKSRTGGFVVSLSGGADSAAVATLVAKMAQLGIDDLQLDGFHRKTAYISSLADCDNAAEVVNQLLTCVYQSTRNSTDITRQAARDVARGLNAKLHELDVDHVVETYTDLVEDALGRELSWQTDDLALQNIQARARGPSAWMITNINRALLLATSNRSEAAVGYATMDGDTCGGLSPIAGIDKAFLRRWLKWMQSAGPDLRLSKDAEFSASTAVPELAAVNAQEPTAELRPPGAKQTDEADLMQYDVLDDIEGAAIRDKQTPLECFLTMRELYPDRDNQQLAAWVELFFHLWCRNQWKRERYAPSFHVDDKNLDPKTWCRFPILSGGFQRELRELRDYVAGLA